MIIIIIIIIMITMKNSTFCLGSHALLRVQDTNLVVVLLLTTTKKSCPLVGFPTESKPELNLFAEKRSASYSYLALLFKLFVSATCTSTFIQRKSQSSSCI